jgi:hypothetical protein
LASQLLQRLLFIIHAILYWLLDSEPSRSGSIKLATPRNIKLRHLVSHGNDQLRTQNYH